MCGLGTLRTLIIVSLGPLMTYVTAGRASTFSTSLMRGHQHLFHLLPKVDGRYLVNNNNDDDHDCAG